MQALTSAEVGVDWALYTDEDSDAQQQMTPIAVLCLEVAFGQLLPFLQYKLAGSRHNL